MVHDIYRSRCLAAHDALVGLGLREKGLAWPGLAWAGLRDKPKVRYFIGFDEIRNRTSYSSFAPYTRLLLDWTRRRTWLTSPVDEELKGSNYSSAGHM